MSKRWMAWTLVVMGGSALGCATAREPTELTDARNAVQDLNASDARTYAPSESADAQRALRSAECTLLTKQGLDKVKARSLQAQEQVARASAVARQNRELADATAAAEQAAAAESQAERDRLEGERAERDRREMELQAQRDLLDTQAQEKAQRLAEAEGEIQRLQDELGFQETKKGQVLTMSGSTLFGFDSATLLTAARPRLERVAEVLIAVDQPVVLEGHTDSVGNANYNRELSERRADSVRKFLVTAGVPATRITVQARGEDDPVAENSSVEGRALNRRVELVLPEAVGGAGKEPAPEHEPGDPTTILPERSVPEDSSPIGEPRQDDAGTGGSGLPEPATPLEGDPYPLDYEERMHSAPPEIPRNVVPENGDARPVDLN